MSTLPHRQSPRPLLESANSATTSDLEATVRRFYEAMSSEAEAFIAQTANEILAADWQDIPLPPGQAPGREGFKAAVAWLHGVFPDYTITPQEMVVSGTSVAVRSVSSGTHAGEFLGVRATGRHVEYDAFDFHRLEAGRITHSWHLEDTFGLLMQLGAAVQA